MPPWAWPDAPPAAPAGSPFVPGPVPDPPLIQGLPDGSCVVYPMSWPRGWGQGYNVPGGWDDATQLNAAHQQFACVRLVDGTYNTQTTVNVPTFNSMLGLGFNSVIAYSGSGSAVFCADPVSTVGLGSGGQRIISTRLEYFVIDLANAGAGAIGLDLWDVKGFNLYVVVRNAAGTNQVGSRFANNLNGINHASGSIFHLNCTTGAMFQNIGGITGAMEHHNVYMFFDYVAGQQGMYLSGLNGGVSVQGSKFKLKFKPTVNSLASINMDAGCAFQTCEFLSKTELSNPAVTATTIQFNAASAQFTNCRGQFFFSPNMIASNIAAANQFQFDGDIIGDANLSALQQSGQFPGYSQRALTAGLVTPAVPANNVYIQNTTGTTVLAYFTGGTISAAPEISASGVGAGTSLGGTATNPIIIPNNYFVRLHYTVAPTSWIWVPVGA
jgi:hypothetical protein